MVLVALIYCVEDDASIRELIGYALKSQGFDVETMENSKEFWKALDVRVPDLLLLDIMLPGESGIDILTELREKEPYKTMPVIMLTAKTSEYDVANGLNHGADDYVKKPFGVMELTSRIHAVLRRCAHHDAADGAITCGPIALNESRHTVTVNGTNCQLTVKEFELLRYLMVNKSIVLTRDRIMEAVWGYSYEGETRTIDMHIRSLRQKLGTAGSWIATVRGVGYVMRDE
ncbi:MAG: response regulator transcription factor [Caecibacter sp.]|jgi:two-component system alkaline phosphatase synthesis response regulator PhoP|nr:response regulator transcription factor [Caecibacter sp.]